MGSSSGEAWISSVDRSSSNGGGAALTTAAAERVDLEARVPGEPAGGRGGRAVILPSGALCERGASGGGPQGSGRAAGPSEEVGSWKEGR